MLFSAPTPKLWKDVSLLKTFLCLFTVTVVSGGGGTNILHFKTFLRLRKSFNAFENGFCFFVGYFVLNTLYYP